MADPGGYAMPKITLEGRVHELQEGETVLDGLIRGGVSVPHACRSGVCHTCKMRATGGTPPAGSQRGLKPAEQAQGWFLPCVCRPGEDLELSRDAGRSPFVGATVVGKEPLGAGILRLRLAPNRPIVYRAGQFLNLRGVDDQVRSYSIASVPGLDDGALELHVRRLPDGRVSGWVHEVVREGDALQIQGPVGDCYYEPNDSSRPLLLIATGCGLAPLWGIVRDALAQGHRAPIHLYHGSRTADGLYLVDELRALARDNPTFHYVRCVSGEDSPTDCRAGRAADIALADHPDLTGWRAYLCGHPEMVRQTRRRIYLAGARLDDILADPFELSGMPSAESPSA